MIRLKEMVIIAIHTHVYKCHVNYVHTVHYNTVKPVMRGHLSGCLNCILCAPFLCAPSNIKIKLQKA